MAATSSERPRRVQVDESHSKSIAVSSSIFNMLESSLDARISMIDTLHVAVVAPVSGSAKVKQGVGVSNLNDPLFKRKSGEILPGNESKAQGQHGIKYNAIKRKEMIEGRIVRAANAPEKRITGKSFDQDTSKNVVAVESELNDDFCKNCGLRGELICCEKCPAAFHFFCW